MSLKTLITMWLVTAALCATAGCYTTEKSRALAEDLEKQVGAYEKSQTESIEKLNAEYRDAFAQLIGDLNDTSVDRLRLERTAQAQAAADKLLLDGKRLTTHTAVIEELSGLRDRQLKQLAERAVALEAARASYAQSYAEIQLELRKLKKVKEQLQALSVEEDQKRTTANFLLTVARIYKEVYDESKKAEASNSGQ